MKNTSCHVFLYKTNNIPFISDTAMVQSRGYFLTSTNGDSVDHPQIVLCSRKQEKNINHHNRYARYFFIFTNHA